VFTIKDIVEAKTIMQGIKAASFGGGSITHATLN
jgi:hypothetical protein